MPGPAGDQSAGPSRRRLLLASGGLAVAAGGGAAGFGLGRATAPGGNATSGRLLRDEAEPPPGEDLMADHGLLIRVLLIYRNLGSAHAAGKPVQARHLHDAALVIHDYIEGFHEELEEAYVFPPLRRAGRLTGTVSTLLLQHARGRQITQLLLAESGGSGPLPGPALDRVISPMAAFVRMYEPHEAREDTVVYPAFRGLLRPAEIAELGSRFAQLEREQFGPDGFGAMVGRVAQIEQALGIYDLAQFTPPNLSPPAS
jgi:hemerythrin-like domain-containing protein